MSEDNDARMCRMAAEKTLEDGEAARAAWARTYGMIVEDGRVLLLLPSGKCADLRVVFLGSLSAWQRWSVSYGARLRGWLTWKWWAFRGRFFW